MKQENNTVYVKTNCFALSRLLKKIGIQPPSRELLLVQARESKRKFLVQKLHMLKRMKGLFSLSDEEEQKLESEIQNTKPTQQMSVRFEETELYVGALG